jgi:hypothetical protein
VVHTSGAGGTLNIVNGFTRECVAIEVDRSLPGARVVRVLDGSAKGFTPEQFALASAGGSPGFARSPLTL